jgi:ribonuclease D
MTSGPAPDALSPEPGISVDPVLEPGEIAAGATETPEAPLAPLLELASPLPAVVETQRGLDELAERFGSGTGPFAIDAERASGYRYSHRAYLLQARRAGAGTALIDPIPFGDVPNSSMAALAAAVQDTEWIIHAASQDLACMAELGMRPTTLFDTELAGRLLNYPRVGLGIMVEELLGFRMRKEHSAVDWSRRPLPEPWLLYAALDVELLIELRNVLADQLDQAGKRGWAEEEFAAWARSDGAPLRNEPWRRTSGIHRVRGRRGLALVRAMWELRDDLARRRDITTNRILSDATIVEAAQAAPKSRNVLARLAGFSTRGGQRYLKEFYAAIAAATDLPEGELPTLGAQHDGPPTPRVWAEKNPPAAARLGRCREAVAALAERYDLPQENLIPPDAVRRLAWTPPDEVTATTVADALRATGARNWQVSLVADDLAAALADR